MASVAPAAQMASAAAFKRAGSLTDAPSQQPIKPITPAAQKDSEVRVSRQSVHGGGSLVSAWSIGSLLLEGGTLLLRGVIGVAGIIGKLWRG